MGVVVRDVAVVVADGVFVGVAATSGIGPASINMPNMIKTNPKQSFELRDNMSNLSWRKNSCACMSSASQSI
jgi:hypothetical protein